MNDLSKNSFMDYMPLNKILHILEETGAVKDVYKATIDLMLNASNIKTGLGFYYYNDDYHLVAWDNVSESIVEKVSKLNITYLLPAKFNYPTLMNYGTEMSFRASLSVIFEKEIEECIIVPLTDGQNVYGIVLLIDFDKQNITPVLEDVLFYCGVVAGVALLEINYGQVMVFQARVHLLVNYLHFTANSINQPGDLHTLTQSLIEIIYYILAAQSTVLAIPQENCYIIYQVARGETNTYQVNTKNYSEIITFLQADLNFAGELLPMEIPQPAGFAILGIQKQQHLSNNELTALRFILAEVRYLFDCFKPYAAGIQIKNRYQEFMSEANKLNAIADKETLTYTVARQARKVVKADKSLIIIKEKTTGKCTVLGHCGFDDQELHFFQKITDRDYFFGNRPLNITIPDAAPGLPGDFKDLFSILEIDAVLIIPIKYLDTFEGSLILLDKSKGYQSYFNIEDEEVMVNLSSHFALLLGNSLMRAEMEKRMVELVTINMVAKTIYSKLYMSELLPILVNIVAKALRARKCWVVMEDESKAALSIKSSWGLEPVDQKHALLKYHEGIAGYVFQTEKPFLTLNVEDDERLGPLERMLYKKGSYIAVAIYLQNRVKGVIHVADKVMGGSFTQEEMNWLINLTNHIAVGMQNAQLYESIKVINDGVFKTLTKIIELKDSYTSGHSERVALLALLIGEKIGLSNTELDILRYGGWLHDIGKIGVPEAILSKPGKLTNDEYDIIRKHPVTGKEILQSINPLNDILPIVLHHHEWYNGNGYPDGLKGDQIPVSARILHIADAVDAMTSNRAYRNALELQRVVEQLKIFSGVQFDPDIVKVVLDTMLFEVFFE